MIAVLATLLTVGVIAPAATPPRAEEFRTEAAPRIDPVFDDVASLRHVIDQFFALHADMERVRDEFSGAVHDTFAALGPIGGRPPQICPAELAPLYARASEQGRRFLALGRRLAGRSREIRRADDLGDTVGLTPDYRIKAKKVRELHPGSGPRLSGDARRLLQSAGRGDASRRLQAAGSEGRGGR